jgi:alkanesulfonate monooxygenase SsuD/methylene tetrahydromethanopterin reductase-like flavin-dependent oxidoreductase (luciferase family)
VGKRIDSIACEDDLVADLRQPPRAGLALRDPLPWKDLAAIVRASEASGYDALFLPEITGRDALVTLGAIAGETRDLRLGTGVLPMRSRTPLLLAMAAATVHERSGGRLVLGVGTGDARRGALDELRALVLELRALLTGGEAERRGRSVRLSLDAGSPVPLWISALGPRAMRLAGEVADGVLLNWCPPERVAFARERVAEGAGSAGRDPAKVAVAVYVRSWVGDDEASALPALKAAAGQYASYPAYARQLEQVGLGELARAAAAAVGGGRPDEVPEALVRAVSAIGDEAGARLAAYHDAGADLTVVYPVAVGDAAPSVERTLLELAPA